MIINDRNVLVLSVFLFPRAGLHCREWRADDDLYVFTAQTAGRAAAVHRRVSAAEYDDRFADLRRVFECDTAEPVDADMNVCGAILTARQIRQIAASRCAGADKYGIVIFFEYCF